MRENAGKPVHVLSCSVHSTAKIPTPGPMSVTYSAYYLPSHSSTPQYNTLSCRCAKMFRSIMRAECEVKSQMRRILLYEIKLEHIVKTLSVETTLFLNYPNRSFD